MQRPRPAARLSSVNFNHDDLMHGEDYAGQDVVGWIVQEKFRGHRCYWNGARLFTRTGKAIPAPKWFTAGLPSGIPLDCELYAGVDGEAVVSAVCNSGRGWEGLRLVVFDSPKATGGYAERHCAVCDAIPSPSVFVQIAPVSRVESAADLNSQLAELQSRGGEGFMLRRPDAGYTWGRVDTLLKLKRPMGSR